MTHECRHGRFGSACGARYEVVRPTHVIAHLFDFPLETLFRGVDPKNEALSNAIYQFQVRRVIGRFGLCLVLDVRSRAHAVVPLCVTETIAVLHNSHRIDALLTCLSFITLAV